MLVWTPPRRIKLAVVGHWQNLAEAEKLVQSVLLKGVVETVIEAGHILPRLPIKQITGKDLLYNREDSWVASSGAGFFDIREPIPWSSDVTYTPVTVPLKRIARQDPIDKFVQLTYSDPNDYRALMVQQLAKRVTRFTEDRILYGDITYNGAKEFDGLHALAAENSGDLNIDQAEGALSLDNVRLMLDAMKVDTEQAGRSSVFLLIPRQIHRRMSAAYQEAGFVRSGVTNSMGQITFGVSDIGARVMFFDGIPLIPSDFLVAEQANTGAGSDARAVNTSGTNQYTVFGIRTGQTEDGGLALLFGGAGNDIAEVFRHETFDKLEDYDSGGERLVSYLALTLGAGHSIGRIYDVTDAAIVP